MATTDNKKILIELIMAEFDKQAKDELNMPRTLSDEDRSTIESRLDKLLPVVAEAKKVLLKMEHGPLIAFTAKSVVTAVKDSGNKGPIRVDLIATSSDQEKELKTEAKKAAAEQAAAEKAKAEEAKRRSDAATAANLSGAADLARKGVRFTAQQEHTGIMAGAATPKAEQAMAKPASKFAEKVGRELLAKLYPGVTFDDNDTKLIFIVEKIGNERSRSNLEVSNWDLLIFEKAFKAWEVKSKRPSPS